MRKVPKIKTKFNGGIKAGYCTNTLKIAWTNPSGHSLCVFDDEAPLTKTKLPHVFKNLSLTTINYSIKYTTVGTLFATLFCKGLICTVFCPQKSKKETLKDFRRKMTEISDTKESNIFL